MAKIVKRIVRDVGSSNVVTIPKEMCLNAGIQEGTVLNIEQVEDKIVLTPVLEVVRK